MTETSAHKDLRRRALSWAAKMHVSPKVIRFRRMCEKWGTCSFGGTVTLASDLVDQESRFQDFVIVHELVHLKVSQHGRAFNEHMSAHLPGWQAMESLRKRTPATCSTKRSKARRSGVKRSRSGGRRRAQQRLHRHLRRRVMMLRKLRQRSQNTQTDTPLAIEYRAARKAYHAAGTALRKSCSSSRQACGFPKGPRGASFTAKNVKSMKSDFLSAPAGNGTNEDIIRAQVGHLGVRDATQWEPIAEKYESGPLETFDAAFAVLAKHSRRGGSLDWREFDLDILQSCPGLGQLQLPLWVQDAQSTREEHGRYYGDVPF